MLDFDTLAEQRAKTLQETEDRWREALWGPHFQSLAQSMSDGEVETLVKACPSVRHFAAVVKFLCEHPERRVLSPYVLLVRSAQAGGLSVDEWIQNL